MISEEVEMLAMQSEFNKLTCRITYGEVGKAVGELKTEKAAGPDRLLPVILKACTSLITSFFYKLNAQSSSLDHITLLSSHYTQRYYEPFSRIKL